jgi:hypothetical protein
VSLDPRVTCCPGNEHQTLTATFVSQFETSKEPKALNPYEDFRLLMGVKFFNLFTTLRLRGHIGKSGITHDQIATFDFRLSPHFPHNYTPAKEPGDPTPE